MTAGFVFSFRTAELIAVVVKRLETQFPTMSRDQVQRCVQVAREPAKQVADDPEAFANIVEALAHDYLAKIHEMQTKNRQLPQRQAVEGSGHAIDQHPQTA
jgi:hypothetical protein